jgi:hypothetical protein
VDDAQTAAPTRGVAEGATTPPPVTDTRTGFSLHAAEGVKTSAGRGATTSPTVIDVDPIRVVPDGARDVAETSLRSTWRREVQEYPVHRYLHLQLRACGCHVDQLIGITPLGRMIGSQTIRTCGLCRPTSSPSTTRSL